MTTSYSIRLSIVVELKRRQPLKRRRHSHNKPALSLFPLRQEKK